MDIAIIAPPTLLELSAISDRLHMVLPEGLIQSEDYKRFYAQSSGYKILDNGIVEGVQFDGTELHSMARDVGANCIVVPDVLRNTISTIQNTRAFERHVDEALHYMGVLQGRDLADIIKCLYFYDHTPWITHIGIPRLLCEFHKMQRVTLVESFLRMQKEGNLRPELKFHALGGSSWGLEVSILAESGCHGHDTSYPVVMGLAGRSIGSDFVSRQSDFMERDVDRRSIQWRILVDNVTRYLEWGGVTPDPVRQNPTGAGDEETPRC